MSTRVVLAPVAVTAVEPPPGPKNGDDIDEVAEIDTTAGRTLARIAEISVGRLLMMLVLGST
jgi:hypothetical protein